jgi:hypothetical protein
LPRIDAMRCGVMPGWLGRGGGALGVRLRGDDSSGGSVRANGLTGSSTAGGLILGELACWAPRFIAGVLGAMRGRDCSFGPPCGYGEGLTGAGPCDGS